MKKKSTFLPVLFVLLSAVIVFSCSKNRLKPITNTQLDLKIQSFREISKLHSNGLDYFYCQLKKDKALLIETKSKSTISETINGMVDSFIQKKKNEIALFEAELSMTKSAPITSSIDGTSISDNGVKIIERCLTCLSSISSSDELQEKIETEIKSKEFAEIGISEQNMIIFMLSVSVDSYEYWNNHYEEWEIILNEDTNSVKTKGFISPAERQALQRSATNKIVQADTWGCATGGLFGGVVGWLTGGICGSIGSALGY